MICENEEFVITAEEKPGCLLEAKIEIKAKKAQDSYKKAVKTINKEISIPGFRKGHVPDNVIISKYGASVEKEWKELLLNDAFNATLKLTSIYPLSKKSIQKAALEKCSQEGGSVFVAYEFYPKVPFIDFKNLQIPLEPISEVSEGEIEAELKQIQLGNATWEPIVGRPIEEGDFVTLSITSVAGEESLAERQRFHVLENKMSAWLRNSLLGHLEGETVETKVVEESNEDSDGSENKVRLHIHALEKAILPDIDDALAIKMGVASLSDLKEKVRARFTRDREAAQKDARYTAAKEAMIQKYPFELPASLLKQEMQERKKIKTEKLKERFSPEELEQKAEALDRETQAEAERGIRLYFINQQVAEQGNIAVSREEVNAYFRENLFFKNQDISEELFSNVSMRLFQWKLKDYVLSQMESYSRSSFN